MFEEINIRTRAIVESDVLLYVRTQRKALNSKDLDKIRKKYTPAAAMKAMFFAGQFDDAKLLALLSSSLWISAENILPSIQSTVDENVDINTLKEVGMSSEDYVLGRLLYLWFCGHCDGRLESMDEYTARESIGGKVTKVRIGRGHIPTRIISELDADEDSLQGMVQPVRLVYSYLTEGKSLHERVSSQLSFVFKKADDTLTRRERLQKAFSLII